MPKINIFWFRRDLRLDDNHGLYHALQNKIPVLPIFIFDENILSHLDIQTDKRLPFIFHHLSKIKTELEKLGSSLLILKGKPHNVFHQLIKDYEVNAVFTNHDYEPYAIQRDNEIRQLLLSYQIGFHSFKDQVIFEKDDIIKPDGSPYTVFTPYSRKWKEKLTEKGLSFYPSEKMTGFLQMNPVKFLDEFEFNKNFSEKVWQARLSPELLSSYAQNRNYPAIDGTTRISVHLRFGTVSVRRLVDLALKYSETWLNELIWREFFMQILYHFPHVVNQSFKAAYNNIQWSDNEKDFERWCRGETGYPIVDAGMRELNETGYMHNRVRMITASFLVKHLLIDWRWGEAYFASKLMDYELSSNNGNWQWAAGSGCDAAPYFRFFNPLIQAQKFDPEMIYIKKWIPEFQTGAYLPPIIEHTFARNRFLNTFKEGLNRRY